jgi:predicted ATPase/DNA-binding SARP family transcriptional activator/predicted negative regulator of RcsB-dependent stress response
MSSLSLYLLGPPRIELDGVPEKVETHKAIALLAYLAVTAEDHTRDELVNFLWPEYDAEHGRTNLRHTLYVLRKSLGGDWLEADREFVRLKPGADIRLDVDLFHSKLVECRAHGHDHSEGCPACIPPLLAATALVRGDFLSGFSLKDSPNFDDWQLLQAESLRREYANALERLVECHCAMKSYQSAIDYARRWLALDRLNEEVHCQLMRIYGWAEQRLGVQRQYQECVQVLKDELDVSPQPSTTALYHAILRGDLPQPVAPFNEPKPSVPAATVGDEHLFISLENHGRELAEVKRNTFVAREVELARLQRWAELAQAGHGRVVFITGDAGRGKTALIQEFARRAQEQWDDLIVAGGNCNAYIGEGDPYLPFREILGLLTGDINALWAAGSISREHAHRLWDVFPLVVSALVETGPDLVNTFLPAAPLLRRAVAYTAGGISDQVVWLSQLQELVDQKRAIHDNPDMQQSALFEQYARVMTSLAHERPLLLILDDLQWADKASLSLLFHLSRRLEGQRILIAGAYRSDEVNLGKQGQRHPLEPLVHELQRTFGEILIDLAQAEDRQFLDQYLESEPNCLSASFRETLYRQTAGHALFTVELLRGMEERGDLVRDQAGCWVEGRALDWKILPSRVEAVIAERLARLDSSAREALEIASVEGESFTAEVVARVRGTSEHETVKQISVELDRIHRLVYAQEMQHLGVQHRSRFRFQHILYQKYLYESLDSIRRTYLHEAVGTALEDLYGSQVEEIAITLARHFHEAGIVEKAIGYMLAAGNIARRSSANAEAIVHLNQALEIIKTHAETPERMQLELKILESLGVCLVLIKGHASVEVMTVYARALKLCSQVGNSSQRFHALMGLRRCYLHRGDTRTALQLSEQLLTLAQNLGQEYIPRAQMFYGEALYRIGEFTKAHEHFSKSITAYTSGHFPSDVHLFGNDTLVIGQVFQGLALWQLGYPDRALEVALEGLSRARMIAHPFTLVCALYFTSALRELRREPQGSQENLELLLKISEDREFAQFSAWGTILLGRSLVEQNQVGEGMRYIQQGLEDEQAMGGKLLLPVHLFFLAEAYGKEGQFEEGFDLQEQGSAILEETGGRMYEAELQRCRGELLRLSGGDLSEAERCFQRALETARGQSARSLELRAAMGLCRLWLDQGKTLQARELLGTVYHAFNEGLDTMDLQDARALLLASAGSEE